MNMRKASGMDWIERFSYLVFGAALLLMFLIGMEQYGRHKDLQGGYALEGAEKAEYDRIAKRHGKQTVITDERGNQYYYDLAGRKCSFAKEKEEELAKERACRNQQKQDTGMTVTETQDTPSSTKKD